MSEDERDFKTGAIVLIFMNFLVVKHSRSLYLCFNHVEVKINQFLHRFTKMCFYSDVRTGKSLFLEVTQNVKFLKKNVYWFHKVIGFQTMVRVTEQRLYSANHSNF
ncbi:hypothetical protein HHI36_005910 [Cryptolaemus montrouzieri]|uniref:Uncharacterized protein n=1 Tax=Cryptolaemus montrouzieri TaxID=559131 RepID=A0ABD2NVF3_9CUCU